MKNDWMMVLAQAAPGERPPGSGPEMFLPMVLFVVLFWVLIIRPQRKKQKAHEAALGRLKAGDKVITAGGIHGLVMAVRDRTVSIKIAENVKVELEKASVATVLTKDSAEGAKDGAAKDSKDAQSSPAR